MQGVNHEKGVNLRLAHGGRRWGHLILARAWLALGRNELVWPGVEALLCGHPE